MEISNKTLTWLVVVAIAVSLFATGGVLLQLSSIKGVTGMLGEGSNVTGQANITIGSQTTLRYTVSAINFGSLSVNTTTLYCNVSINASPLIIQNTSFVFQGCLNQTGQPVAAYPLTLENAGSTNMNITLNFSHNAASLIQGGSVGGSPVLMFTVNNNESGSCTTGLIGAATWTNITAGMVNNETLVCGNLSYIDTTDSLIIGLKLGIPMDAPASTTARSLRIKAQGISISP